MPRMDLPDLAQPQGQHEEITAATNERTVNSCRQGLQLYNRDLVENSVT